MVEIIMTHWNIYYDKFLKGIGQNWMSADIAYALAVRLLDIEDTVVIMISKMYQHLYI